MQRNFNSHLTSIAPVTLHLLIINVIMWLAALVLQNIGLLNLNYILGLHYWKSDSFMLHQFVTYMFMHDTHSFAHIFFNMFSLWMFGSLVERVLTSKRYLTYYILCGLGAALAQELVWQFLSLDAYYSITVGASGAVFGILLAFGMLFPNMKMYIIPFPFPIKAKWVVLGYGALELFFGISGAVSGVAHFAHLGGMLVGLILILYWKRSGKLNIWNGFY